MNNLIDFVRESNRIEGIDRDPTPLEIAAHERFLLITEIDVIDLREFVAEIQPGAALRREPGMNVRVGGHYPPEGGPQIERKLMQILNGPENAFWQHHLYETLHPFMDGNGRSGRALWLWKMNGEAPLGFLHTFYYQTLSNTRIDK